MSWIRRLGILISILMIYAHIHAQDIEVRNVTFKQIKNQIFIRYDLNGRHEKKYKITLSLSDDYGASYRINPIWVRGDVGKNVTSGQGKEIVWNMTEDFPDGIGGEGFVFAVDAKLQKSSSAIFYLLGGGVATGVTYFLLSKPKKGSVSITIPGDI